MQKRGKKRQRRLARARGSKYSSPWFRPLKECGLECVIDTPKPGLIATVIDETSSSPMRFNHGCQAADRIFQEAIAPSQPSFSRLPPCFSASPVLGNPVCSLPACLVSCFFHTYDQGIDVSTSFHSCTDCSAASKPIHGATWADTAT